MDNHCLVHFFCHLSFCPDLLCRSLGPWWESFRRHQSPLQMGSAWKSQWQLCSDRPRYTLLTSPLCHKFHGILITLTRAAALWFILLWKKVLHCHNIKYFYSNVLSTSIKQAFWFLHFLPPKSYFLNMCILYNLICNFR